MATSNVTTFSLTRNEIIQDILSLINVIGEDEQPTAYDTALCVRILNSMVKAWEAQGIHLWTKSTAIVFLQKNQSVYQLASTGAHASTEWWSTTLNADAVVTATSLTVVSTADMTVGDYIGVEQSDNTLHWSTIASITDATTVVINDGLTVAAESGAVVWNYTTRLDQPVKVYSANYRSRDDRDVPMEEISYQTYFELPNKDNTGTPVSYNFDKQRDYSVIRVWLTPANVKFTMVITFARKLQDFVDPTDNPDFPQEWYECIIHNAAVRVAKWYGKNKGEKYQDLKADAAAYLAEMLDFDDESGSLFLGPRYEGEYAE